MSELKIDQIIEALECCTSPYGCMKCQYQPAPPAQKGTMACCEALMLEVLAFLKGQEQKIFELENLLKESENGYEQTLYLERCKLHDAEEKIKELTAENERLTINMNAYGLAAKRLGEERASVVASTVLVMQERLKAKLNDTVRWAIYGDKNEYFIIGKPFIDQIAKELLEESTNDD